MSTICALNTLVVVTPRPVRVIETSEDAPPTGVPETSPVATLKLKPAGRPTAVRLSMVPNIGGVKRMSVPFLPYTSATSPK